MGYIGQGVPYKGTGREAGQGCPRNWMERKTQIDMQEYVMPILTLIFGGGFGWLFTWRATRKKADADAMKSVQDVYQQTIDDLNKYVNDIRTDRNALRKDRDEMRDENKRLQDKLDRLENDIRDLRNVVARNSRKVDAMRPLVCLKAPTCTMRADINIVTEEEQG